MRGPAAGSPGWLLQMTGRQRVLLKITVAGFAANLLLNFAAVNLAGMTGVAAATALTIAGQNCAMVAAARRAIGVRTYARVQAARRSTTS